MNLHLRASMRKLSRDLAGALEETATIAHTGVKGDLREEAVVAAFRPHVPAGYEVSSGIVTNGAGEDSKQQDVIISDTHVLPPFIKGGRAGVHPVEPVRAVVEVKSLARKKDVTEGVEKGASVAALIPNVPQPTLGMDYEVGGFTIDPRIHKPFAGIVCLDQDASVYSAAKAFEEANKGLPAHDRSYSLLILGRALVVWRSGRWMVGPAEGEEIWAVEFGDDALLWFYAGLLRGMQLYQPLPFELNQYTTPDREVESWRVADGPPGSGV
jgi:hypothetical protein